DNAGYADWSAKIVREELQKAGWRLADLLSQTVTSTTTSAPAAPIPPEPMPAQPISPVATTTVAATAAPTKSAAAASRMASPASDFGQYPANFKEIVIAWMKANGLEASKIDWQGEPKVAALPGRN